MEKVAGIRFRRAGRVYFFDADGFEDLTVDDRVIVETARGLEAGWVVVAPGQVVEAQFVELKPIVRRAGWEELSRLAELRVSEPNTLARVRERIAHHGLPMRAIMVEYNFDGSQLSVYFVSEERRVDFRVLVRDLARMLGTRVHLRQVGPRDQAKMLGGLNRCGRELCCSLWLPDFQPISVRMAKTQGLPLNPNEISGMCGKLLCCLRYENEQYAESRQGLPKVGAAMAGPDGRGRVVDVNVLARRFTVEWETGTRTVMDAEGPAEVPDAADPDEPDVEIEGLEDDGPIGDDLENGGLDAAGPDPDPAAPARA